MTDRAQLTGDPLPIVTLAVLFALAVGIAVVVGYV